jgi:glycosyltransferase involved in cell wall biosynthesis
MPPSKGLSVCMIVKDESANLVDALECFRSFADEIIVVDTGSKDNTKEIAVQFTSRIYDFKWGDDFAAARNFAMSKACRSYQLWVDADDRITPENRNHIQALKSFFDGKKAFYFLLENHRPPSLINSCAQLRCIPLMPGVRFEGRVHEQIFPSAARVGLEMVTTDIVIRHMGYMNEEVRAAKTRRNLAIMEKERAEGRDDGELHFFMAMAYASLEKRHEAVRSMKEALERFEKENRQHHFLPECYLLLAKLGLEMDDYDMSLGCLARAGGLVNGSPQHRFNIGILYQKMGKHREAIEMFRQVLGKNCVPGLFPSGPLPNTFQLLLHMAYSFYCMNDLQEALKLINDSARECGSDVGKSWEWLGTKAFLLNNPELASIGLETALRFGTLEPAGWRRLAAVYKAKGLSLKAEECLKHAAGRI